MTVPYKGSVMDNKLSKALSERTLIFDGAMGTELYKRNFFINTSFESLSLSSPAIIKEIHESYKDAGSEVLTTNTYCANFPQLNKFLLGDKVREINAAAVRIAREVAGEDLLVAGSIGPVGEHLADDAKGDPARIVEYLHEQISAQKEEGVDFLIFESLRHPGDLEAVLLTMKEFPLLPFITSFALDSADPALSAEKVLALIAKASAAEKAPEAIGLNCGTGPEGMLTAMELILPKCSLPVIAQPNAGVPKKVDNRMIYMCSPEYFTTYAIRMLNLGARGIGGCCGTGPDHIRDMARSVKPLARAAGSASHVFSAAREEAVPVLEEAPLEERSPLGAKLKAGKWITNIEITPPMGYSLEKTIKNARLCAEAGFDAVNIPDGPRASSRVSAMVAAYRIKQEANIDVILHVCCRDRNLIGLQAELLGCAALGIHDLLFITGDPPKLGNYPFASGVFDLDSIGMLKVQKNLNCGIDIGGKSIGEKTYAVSGAGADPNAIDMKREIRRTQEKIDAGAEFITTQPVFDIEPLLRFIDAVPGLANIPVIAGIWPLASYRNAEFMRNEVPGVVVPDSVMERMKKADTKEAQREEGIAIAREAVQAIRNKVAGVQISAPFGNVNTAIAVIK